MLGACQIQQGDTRQFLQSTADQFDLIFLDPPFADHNLLQLLGLIQERGLLSVGGLVYLECAKQTELELSSWKLVKEKQAGQVQMRLLALP